MATLLGINLVRIAMSQGTKAGKQGTHVVNCFNHKVNGSFKCTSFYRSFKLNIQDIWERIYKSDIAFTSLALNTFISLVRRAFIVMSIKTIPLISIK